METEYPQSLVWGRIGREAHMRRIQQELFEEFRSMFVPAALAWDMAERAAAIFGNWDPFISTWFRDSDYDV